MWNWGYKIAILRNRGYGIVIRVAMLGISACLNRPWLSRPATLRPRCPSPSNASTPAPPSSPLSVRSSALMGLLPAYDWQCNAQQNLAGMVLVSRILRVSQLDVELSLFIQLTPYRLSVWANSASYGAKLQDLEYTIA